MMFWQQCEGHRRNGKYRETGGLLSTDPYTSLLYAPASMDHSSHGPTLSLHCLFLPIKFVPSALYSSALTLPSFPRNAHSKISLKPQPPCWNAFAPSWSQVSPFHHSHSTSCMNSFQTPWEGGHNLSLIAYCFIKIYPPHLPSSTTSHHCLLSSRYTEKALTVWIG